MKFFSNVYIIWADFYWDFYSRPNKYRIIRAESKQDAERRAHRWGMKHQVRTIFGRASVKCCPFYQFPVLDELLKWTGIKPMHSLKRFWWK